MKYTVISLDNLSRLLQALFLTYLISIICSFNFISSASIGLILLAGMPYNKICGHQAIIPSIKNIFFLLCLLFYLLQLMECLSSLHSDTTWIQLRIKSGLLFVPFAIINSAYFIAEKRSMLLRWFSLLLAIALLYCLLVNAIDYFSRNDPSVFFYHALVKPLSQHAVYFSIYICIALFFLIDTAGKKEFLFYKSFHFFLIIYLSVFLFLLSSKLVISVYLLFLIYIILSSLRRKINLFLLLSLLLAIVLTVFILLVSRNPVSNRFREIIDTDLKLIKQTRYEPDIYFNDVQLRLIEWKLVTEILNEKNSWLTGAGMGDAQDLLDKKYREKNMYLGEPGRGDKGYLGYNTHNQLLESLLQSGIPGAILFLLILLSMVWMAIHKKNRLLSFTILLLVMYSLFESVFETQYGILLFTFFPLFLSLKAEKTKSEVQQA